MGDPRKYQFDLPARGAPSDAGLAEVWYPGIRKCWEMCTSSRIFDAILGIRAVVIHATAGGSSAGAVAVMKAGKASFHWLVPDEDERQHGQLVWACAPEARAAWHVRNSCSHPRVNGGAKRVNHWSLGIKLVNAQAHDDGFSDWQVRITAQIVRYCWAKYPNLKHIVSTPGSIPRAAPIPARSSRGPASGSWFFPRPATLRRGLRPVQCRRNPSAPRRTGTGVVRAEPEAPAVVSSGAPSRSCSGLCEQPVPAAQGFQSAAPLLAFQALAPRARRNLRRLARPGRLARARQQRAQTLEGVIAVALLRAETVGLDEQDTVPCQPSPRDLTEALLHRGLEGRRIGYVEAQLHGARDLVDVLPARSPCADKAEVYLLIRDAERLAHTEGRPHGDMIVA